MGEQINKHGLSRYIDAEIRRSVRQRDKFCCVMCCGFIYDYEHVDPEFKDALEHKYENITLLCKSCHGNVTNKLWSKDKVKMAMKLPCGMKRSGVLFEMDLGIRAPYIKIGGVTLTRTSIPLSINKIPLFQVKPPEIPGTPFLLSANFFNDKEELSFRIKDNVYEVMVDKNWDIETVGPTTTFRDGHRKIHLKIRLDPPHGIIIEKINSVYNGKIIEGNQNRLTIRDINDPEEIFDARSCWVDGSQVGISIGLPPDGMAAGIIF